MDDFANALNIPDYILYATKTELLEKKEILSRSLVISGMESHFLTMIRTLLEWFHPNEFILVDFIGSSTNKTSYQLADIL